MPAAGLEPAGLLVQVREPDPRRGAGEDLVGLGGEVVGQVQGGVADGAGAVPVDHAGRHPRQRGRQPAGDAGRQRGQLRAGRGNVRRPVPGEHDPRRHGLGIAVVARGLRHEAPPPPGRSFIYTPR
jgi:hypothetical protein